MANCCGKNCYACRDKVGCAGCAQLEAYCPVAQCCREKSHSSCDTCTEHISCALRRGAYSMARTRREKEEAEALSALRLRSQSVVLVKWLRPLFWLMLFSEIFSLIANNILMNFPFITLAVSSALILLRGLLMLQLRGVSDKYRLAGLLLLAPIPLNLLAETARIQEMEVVTIPVGVISSLISFAAVYYEYNAHSDVLAGADNELSEKWSRLWKVTVGSLAAVLVSPVIMKLILLAGVIIMCAGAVAMLIAYVLYFINLWKTIEVFRYYAE